MVPRQPGMVYRALFVNGDAMTDFESRCIAIGLAVVAYVDLFVVAPWMWKDIRGESEGLRKSLGLNDKQEL